MGQFEISGCHCTSRRLKKPLPMRRAKIIHSRKNLDAKVGCTKEVMVAKYTYRIAIQEARTTRWNWLQGLETKYLGSH